MATIPETLAIAVQHHQAEAGRLRSADQFYRQVLQADPSLAEAHYYLGALCRTLGKLDEAAANLQQAVQRGPDYAN